MYHNYRGGPLAKHKTLTGDYFQEIRESLQKSHNDFVESYSDEEINIREHSQAQLILDVMEKIHNVLDRCFSEHSSLKSLFDGQFEDYDRFATIEIIQHICFVDDYLFPEKDLCPIVIDGEVNFEMLNSYVEYFENWTKTHIEDHLKTQHLIKEDFDLDVKYSELACQCVVCSADYRGKIRDFIYKQQIDLIDETYSKLEELIDSGGEDRVSDAVYKLRKNLDKGIRLASSRLKRASLHKLEQQVKSYFEDRFKIDSGLGKKYIDSMKPIFESFLLAEGLRRDLVGESEYARFFSQLGLGVWKQHKILQREFKTLIRTVLALKRKDISAKILQEYLGQFWLYSPARRINRKIIYHMGPTNSGKTHFAVQALRSAKKGCYLAPLRLLAAEWYDSMNAQGVKTTLLTGEEVIEVEGATHYSSTIEMARFGEDFDCCVIDEIQMIGDSQRGWAWTRALIGISADEVHICGDNSVLELVQQVLKLTGDNLEIRNYERLTELKVEPRAISLGEMQRSDALIVFSRKNALKYKADLEKLGFKVSVVYGRLGPEVRKEQARKFDVGETDIMVATDAIAMGMNLPIRRIVFSTFSKFIDSKEYILNFSEIKQISGRAGRYQRFPIGHVTCLKLEEERRDLISDALSYNLDQKKVAMVGPDLDIYQQVNKALEVSALPVLSLVEFLRLFNTMTFEKPFYCVDLKEMIELAEMVDNANQKNKSLTISEIFGFSCAPVNLGLMEHVQYFVWILNRFAQGIPIPNEEIQYQSNNIDYLETTIKCVELYQWLARHFNNKNFDFNQNELMQNKSMAIDQLNSLLAEKIVKRCSSCGAKLDDAFKFFICEDCFKRKRFRGRPESKPSSGKGPVKSDSRKGSADSNKRGKSSRSRSFKKKQQR